MQPCPRLSDVTITAVECTNDLSYATVYYSLLTEDPEKEKEAFSFTYYSVLDLAFLLQQLNGQFYYHT